MTPDLSLVGAQGLSMLALVAAVIGVTINRTTLGLAAITFAIIASSLG